MRVNIGCGSTPIDGWLILDNSLAVRATRYPLLVHGLRMAGAAGKSSHRLASVARAENIKYANAVRRIPCPDNSAEAIYSAHMIEHLDRAEARLFLAEVRRVLRPHGILRLAAPHLSLLIQDYLGGRDADDFVLQTYLAQPQPSGLLPTPASSPRCRDRAAAPLVDV
jgi:SAM-dependent methyltransferase